MVTLVTRRGSIRPVVALLRGDAQQMQSEGEQVRTVKVRTLGSSCDTAQGGPSGEGWMLGSSMNTQGWSHARETCLWLPQVWTIPEVIGLQHMTSGIVDRPYLELLGTISVQHRFKIYHLWNHVRHWYYQNPSFLLFTSSARRGLDPRLVALGNC